MDELDVLKQHWNKDNNFPKINREEIKEMLHKSSSSMPYGKMSYMSFIMLFFSFSSYFSLKSIKILKPKRVQKN
jgi:hypothetical protein